MITVSGRRQYLDDFVSHHVPGFLILLKAFRALTRSPIVFAIVSILAFCPSIINDVVYKNEEDLLSFLVVAFIGGITYISGSSVATYNASTFDKKHFEDLLVATMPMEILDPNGKEMGNGEVEVIKGNDVDEAQGETDTILSESSIRENTKVWNMTLFENFKHTAKIKMRMLYTLLLIMEVGYIMSLVFGEFTFIMVISCVTMNLYFVSLVFLIGTMVLATDLMLFKINTFRHQMNQECCWMASQPVEDRKDWMRRLSLKLSELRFLVEVFGVTMRPVVITMVATTVLSFLLNLVFGLIARDTINISWSFFFLFEAIFFVAFLAAVNALLAQTVLEGELSLGNGVVSVEQPFLSKFKGKAEIVGVVALRGDASFEDWQEMLQLQKALIYQLKGLDGSAKLYTFPVRWKTVFQLLSAVTTAVLFVLTQLNLN